MLKKSKKKLSLILLSAVLSLMAVSLPFMPAISNIASAAKIYEDSFPAEIDVSLSAIAYDKNGAAITGSDSTVNIEFADFETNSNFPVTSYDWKDVKYFKVSFNGKNNLQDLSEELKYTYEYNVTFIPTEIDGATLNAANAARQEKTIYSGESTTKFGIVDTLYFFIDDNIPKNELGIDVETFNGKPAISAVSDEVFGDTSASGFSYTVQGGWGTYLFGFKYKYTNDEITYTNLMEVKPTKFEDVKNETLVVSYKIVPSSTSLSNAYVFTVNDPFLYINRDLISWKITGTASDGTKYVLRPADVTAEGESTLYPSNDAINVKGASIKLDTGIQGKWKAQATITKGGEQKVSLESDEVSTIIPFSTEIIIWISIGVAAIALISVVIIISVNIKKERTW